MSFSPGSAAGPDDLCPQHLKELVTISESSQELLTDLTAFVNMLLSGCCPKSVTLIFFGGRILGLNKKCGRIRPIAIEKVNRFCYLIKVIILEIEIE